MARVYLLVPIPESSQNVPLTLRVRLPQSNHHVPAVVVDEELAPVFQTDCFKVTCEAYSQIFWQSGQLDWQKQPVPLRNPIHIPFAVGLCAPAQIQKSGALCCTLLSDIWNYGLGCSDGRAASWGLGAGKSGALLRTTLVKKMDLWERLPVKTFKDLWQTWACKARMESKTGSSFSPSFSINEMRPTLSAPCATPTCARPVKHPADFF